MLLGCALSKDKAKEKYRTITELRPCAVACPLDKHDEDSCACSTGFIKQLALHGLERLEHMVTRVLLAEDNFEQGGMSEIMPRGSGSKKS